jgi:hypothetical protein
MVVGLDPEVHDVAVQHRRHEVVADALDAVRLQAPLVVQLVGLREDGALRIHSDDLDAGDTLLQLASDASERAARARPAHR